MPRRQRKRNSGSTLARIRRSLPGAVLGAVMCAATASAQTADDASAATAKVPDQNRISCQSPAGDRQHCPADVSSGVALVTSTGAAPCLLGKTWGYDDTGIWVSDGCSADFIAGPAGQEQKNEKLL